jgi:hypothetical protein
MKLSAWNRFIKIKLGFFRCKNANVWGLFCQDFWSGESPNDKRQKRPSQIFLASIVVFLFKISETIVFFFFRKALKNRENDFLRMPLLKLILPLICRKF